MRGWKTSNCATCTGITSISGNLRNYRKYIPSHKFSLSFSSLFNLINSHRDLSGNSAWYMKTNTLLICPLQGISVVIKVRMIGGHIFCGPRNLFGAILHSSTWSVLHAIAAAGTALRVIDCWAREKKQWLQNILQSDNSWHVAGFLICFVHRREPQANMRWHPLKSNDAKCANIG